MRRSGGRNMAGNWRSCKREICDISKVSHPLPAAKSSQWCSLVAVWYYCIDMIREGQHEQAAHRTGQSNTNQFIPFLWNNMQSFSVCYKACITSFLFLCLFTHSLFLMYLWFVLVDIVLKCWSVGAWVRVRVCVCVQYKNVKVTYENYDMSWVWKSY